MAQLSPSILSAALEGLELQKQRVQQQIAEVRAMLSPSSARAPKQAPAPSAKKASNKKRAKRTMSDEGRKRIADAVRKRWDEYRKNKEQA